MGHVRDPRRESLLDGEDVVWAHYPTTRNLKNLLRNAALALRVLRRRDVEVVVTTGAGVALPFVALARLRGIPTVYIEVYDRIDTATLTARLCRPVPLRHARAVGGAAPDVPEGDRRGEPPVSATRAQSRTGAAR